MTELWRLDVQGLMERLGSGAVTSSEVVESCLDRIDRFDRDISAFTAVDVERARLSARQSDDRYRSAMARPLEGVPIAVKEVIAVEGLPFTGQSLTRQGVVAETDAKIVSMLRELGAVVIGTTRTSELACGITTQNESTGSTSNPWDLSLIPGGSSGGSAAAVAAGFVPLALASDTACSARLPAACCGVSGFKPTQSLLSVDGVIPAAPEFDVVGLVARRAGDIALVMDLLGVVDDVSASPKTLGLVGLPANLLISDDQVDALSNTVDAARRLGMNVVDVAWPFGPDLDYISRVLPWSATLETHRDVLKTWPSVSDLYSESVRRFLEASEKITDADIAMANRFTEELRPRVEAIFDAVDAVIMPAMAGPPSPVSNPDVVEIEGVSVPFRDTVIPWNFSINLYGLPSCAVPAGPKFFQSVQIVGAEGDDGSVLSIASELQSAIRPHSPQYPELVAGSSTQCAKMAL